MIEIKKKSGSIYYNQQDIIYFIEEQIKLIPGILGFKKKGIIKKIRHILNLSTGNVKIFQINENEIYIEIKIILDKNINFNNIDEEIRNILEYSLYKKYNLRITGIKINIEDLV